MLDVFDCFSYLVQAWEKMQPESCKDFGLMFIVISLWSAKSAPRNWPHGLFAAHDLSLQAINCRTWPFEMHILQKGGTIMRRLACRIIESLHPRSSVLNISKENTPGASSRKTWVVFLPELVFEVSKNQNYVDVDREQQKPSVHNTLQATQYLPCLVWLNVSFHFNIILTLSQLDQFVNA